ncbi:hypothetical protein [Gordonia polyisoprenivorans]|uniref:hypothetical protein n=1 Tax=Gordonia polyisoprenivorans TaxID=84595 RepID=UPI0023019A16|nr:hypothetical protein [Gordonia polyisoprenivorans]WCB38198.1 hypothetical protein PHA63_03325 [Gordonia polyisoprenivorans]
MTNAVRRTVVGVGGHREIIDETIGLIDRSVGRLGELHAPVDPCPDRRIGQ